MEDDDVFDEADFYGSSDTTASDAPSVDFDFESDDDVGQGEVADEGTEDILSEEPAAPQAKYFDPSTVADHLVKVKVDGEEIDVPVSELTSGYSRTADYTRKTQALAQEREQIAFWQQVDQAMRTNPQLTLEYLQQTYGITPAQASAVTAAAAADDDTWEEDPVQRELRELRAQVQPVIQYAQVQQAEVALKQTLAGLSTKYGDDFNPTEVVQEAIRRGISDVTALEFVFKDMHFDRLRAQAEAAKTFQGQAAQSDAQRRAAAQAAAAVTGAGRSASGVAASQPNTKPSGRMTVRDAFQLAKAELGAT